MSLPQTLLFLCDYQAPYGGGFIPALRALESALEARGTRVIWVFPEGAKARDWCAALEEAGRAPAFLPAGRLKRLFTLDRLVRRRRVGLIHAHFGLFGLARVEALLHPRLRVFLHVHSDFSGGAQPSPLRRLAKTLLNSAAKGRVTRVMVGAHMAAREKGAVYVPNGVDFSREAACTETRESARARLGIREGQRLVLLFGWSPYIKGADIAARAVARLKEEGFLLGVVTGREMTADKLAAWLRERGCSMDAVRCLPPTEDVFAYHRAADVMLSASRSETFSYALAEALYAKTPCVMSDIPGTAWAVAYETVSAFPSGDDAACAEALRAAVRGYTAEAYESAREAVAAAHSLDRWAEGVLAVYEARA